MKTSSVVWIVIVVVVVVAIAGYFWWASSSLMSPYSSAGVSTSTPYTAATSPTGQVQQNPSDAPMIPASGTITMATLNLSTSDGDTAGDHLVAANGMTVYEYNKDTANVSNCTGSCAAAWPPYTVSVQQLASLGGGAGVTAKIGTIKRADGSLQVTYDNFPLYFFAQDAKPGDTNGQGVGGFFTVAP